jgi:hypothetical protein
VWAEGVVVRPTLGWEEPFEAQDKQAPPLQGFAGHFFVMTHVLG